MQNKYFKAGLFGAVLLTSTSAMAAVPSYSTGFDDASSLTEWRGGRAVVVQWDDPACTSYNSQYDYDFANPGTDQVAALVTSDATGSSVLNTFSDYNNAAFQPNGCVTVNIFREYTIAAGDEGDYEFKFVNAFPNDPANTAVSAQAFIKILDPNNGYNDVLSGALVQSVTGSEGEKTISVTIDSSAAGLILQYGFSNASANYQETGMYYDDVCFDSAGACPSALGGGGSTSTADPNAIPALPLWALFGLAGVVGLMGLRRKA
mgnify:FL=1